MLPLLLLAAVPASAELSLSSASASRFAHLALNCAQREYPNKPEHVLLGSADARTPKELHPAFYGCYDWHSSVHGHWLLAHLLRQFPELPEAAAIRKALDQSLSPENVAAEARYLQPPERKTFERMYGWAWLLKLDEELRTFDDPQAKRWLEALRPLSLEIVGRAKAFLPKQTYPIRTGVHPNTAFGLGFALDYARAAADAEFEALIKERSRTYYAKDRDLPASWEPGGEDFFSPALMEADLMRRVLPREDFAAWLSRALPRLPAGLREPATVSDRSDPKIVHLDGLNLSRAWAMRSVASALPKKHALQAPLARAAEVHLTSALNSVASGDYAGEHWLATFAVYALSTPRPTPAGP